MHPDDVSFEVVQARPDFLCLRTIWEKALPEPIIWAQYLVHSLPVAIQIILSRESISAS